jgi:hypothetical protein
MSARPKLASLRPMALGPQEMRAIRLLFAIVIWFTVPPALSLTTQPHPVGLARFVDLTFLAKPGVLSGMRIALVPLLALYVWGRFPWLAIPLLLAATVLPGTLDNSQGSTQHSLQVVSLILLAQAVGVLAGACGLFGKDKDTPLSGQRWNIFLSQQAIVAAYVVTAITKLHVSGLGWIVESRNFPIQMTKNLRMQYYNTLEDATANAGFWAALPHKVQAVFLDSPNFCRLVLSGGLALELFAFLALLGRRWAAAYGALLIVFHVLVRAMTGLNFRYHMAVLFAFLVLPWILGKCPRRVTAAP